MKYCVTITRTGWVFVEAADDAEAFDIANRLTTDAVSWSDDWGATYAEEDDSLDDACYIRGDDL